MPLVAARCASVNAPRDGTAPLPPLRPPDRLLCEHPRLVHRHAHGRSMGYSLSRGEEVAVRLPGAGVGRRGAAAAQHRLEAPASDAHELGSLAAAARHRWANQQVEQALRACHARRSPASSSQHRRAARPAAAPATGPPAVTGGVLDGLGDGLRDPRVGRRAWVPFVIDGRKALDAAGGMALRGSREAARRSPALPRQWLPGIPGGVLQGASPATSVKFRISSDGAATGRPPRYWCAAPGSAEADPAGIPARRAAWRGLRAI